jgi:inhibitor of cysteine peptidase
LVQKEVMKKTRNYGLIGILLAIMCVAMIYSYGTTPGIGPIFPSPSVLATDTPNGTPNPSVVPTPGTTPVVSPSPVSTPVSNPEPEISPMKTFSSIGELQDFLNASNANGGYGYYLTDSRAVTGTGMPVPAPVPTTAPMPASISAAESATKDFSTTNIQVAGVDEADTVKTDGKYLYVIGNNSQVVYIMDANPQNAKVLAKIFLNNTYLSGVYLSSDGNKLAVLGNQWVPYDYFPYDYKVASPGFATDMIMPSYWNSGTTFVKVYDIANKANPVLARNFTMTGSYVNSRLIGNYLYDIVTESAYLVNSIAVLPAVFSGPNAYSVEPTKIYYANTSDTYYTYTTIIAMDIMNAASVPTNKTLMMGSTGTIYVSQSNIYVTCPVTTYETVVVNTSTPPSSERPPETPKSTDSSGNGSSSTVTISPPAYYSRPTWQGTSIYRIHVAGASMNFVAQGNVTGNVLNQYAMDESNGYFRTATTSYDYSTSTTDWWGGGTQQNNVYVLDMSLKLVGKLENLGTGENFHSARFMGNRLYMVTFQKTDPLFVIDLSVPTNPRLLGELIMPGYSDYLHPIDETHLIGLGKDAVASSQGNFAWYQGMKLSIYDVSNIAAPREMASYMIGDRGTSSEALYDPKAFLFDASKNLLVIPVDLYLINRTAATPTPRQTATPTVTAKPGEPSIMPQPVPPIWGGDSAIQYGQFVWQGAYIFNVSVNGGFVLRGNVTQMDNAAAVLANPSLIMMSSYQWMEYNHFINRAVYIGNVLYTFSQSRVQLNSLDNFALLAKIDLN